MVWTSNLVEYQCQNTLHPKYLELQCAVYVFYRTESNFAERPVIAVTMSLGNISDRKFQHTTLKHVYFTESPVSFPFKGML